MGKYVASELKKYYTKYPGKTLFRNGLNQRQVAGHMNDWLMGAGHGTFSGPYLSKILKGERPMLPVHVPAFCYAVPLSQMERRDLEIAVYKDQRQIVVWEAANLLPPHDYQLASDCLKQIVRLNHMGYPYQAMEQAAGLGRWLHEETPLLRFPDPLHTIRARLLFEVNKALCEIVSPSELRRRSGRLCAEIREIGEFVEDEEPIGLAMLAEAEVAIVAHSYGAADFMLKQALKVLKNEDYRLEALRLSVLASASMGSMGLFEKAEGLCRQMLECSTDASDEQLCSTWAGLGHGLAIIGQEEKARAAIERAALICTWIERVQPAPRLKIQILLANISLQVRSEGLDRINLKSDVKKGHALARQFRLKRYQSLFEEMDV